MADNSERRQTEEIKFTRIADSEDTVARSRYDANLSVETTPVGMIDNWVGTIINTDGASGQPDAHGSTSQPDGNSDGQQSKDR